MLPREDRLHRPADFTEVVRRGRRSSRPLLTVHALLGDDGEQGRPRAGLVVSKAIGGSVVRSTVSRRLRHLLRARPGFHQPDRIVHITVRGPVAVEHRRLVWNADVFDELRDDFVVPFAADEVFDFADIHDAKDRWERCSDCTPALVRIFLRLIASLTCLPMGDSAMWPDGWNPETVPVDAAS